MDELAKRLPELIIYISLGFIFVKTYKFIRIIKPAKDQQGAVFEYLTVGFVIYKIFNAIPFTLGDVIDIIGISFCTFVSSIILASFVNSKKYDTICKLLKIHQTPNDDIWRDIEDRDCGIYIKVEDLRNKTTIDGLLVLYEQHNKTPYIQLSEYRVVKSGEMIEDHSDEPHRTILLDTSKYDTVSITYDEDSDKVKSWSK